MLMYTVSLELQLPACVTIYNQCSNIKLTSPVYFGNGVECPKLSNQQIDIGIKMNASFEINITQEVFEGALLFKLQRYSDNQYNMDMSTTETNKSEATHVHMLAIWKVKDSKSFIRITLVEHTKKFTWNEDKLRKLYHKNRGWLKEYCTISDIWLVDNNMVFKTTFGARVLKGTTELSISISEERYDYAMRPLSIDFKR
jgi:hypothetical protein